MTHSASIDAGGAQTRHSVGRKVMAVAASFALLLTAGSAAGWLAITRLSNNVTVLDVSAQLGIRPTKAPPAQVKEYDPINLLVMGSDTRTGQGGGFGNPNLTSSGNGQSDTTILVHLSGDRRTAFAVSIPRDSWVTRPACKGTGGGVVTGKFNAAFEVGGAGCTIAAVESLTGVFVDHFVVVNFKGFKTVVDALGGVPVCVASAIDDKKSNLKLPAGTTVVNGDQALAFVRARKTLGDGSDTSRIDRQQVFLSALIRKATDKGLLTSPTQLYSVLSAVTDSLTVDPGLSTVDELKGMATSLAGLKPSDITFLTVPWKSRGDGENVLWIDSKAEPIWAAMKADTAYPPKATVVAVGEKPLKTPPADVHVRVLNGTGTSGIAKKAAAELTALGFIVDGVGTADRGNYGVTTVKFDPKYDESARTLTYAAKTTTTNSQTGLGRTITLIIGKDWTGARAVTVSPSPSASGSKSGGKNAASAATSCVG